MGRYDNAEQYFMRLLKELHQIKKVVLHAV